MVAALHFLYIGREQVIIGNGKTTSKIVDVLNFAKAVVGGELAVTIQGKQAPQHIGLGLAAVVGRREKGAGLTPKLDASPTPENSTQLTGHAHGRLPAIRISRLSYRTAQLHPVGTELTGEHRALANQLRLSERPAGEGLQATAAQKKTTAQSCPFGTAGSR